MDTGRFAAGLVAAGLVALAAKSHRSLSTDGAGAATLVGGCVVGGTGWWGGALVVFFFVSSTLLGWLPRRGPEAVERRGNERDAVQVFSNGGVAALVALLLPFAPADWPRPLVAAFAGAVAAATADTWGTEVGSRFGGIPRSVFSKQPVPSGMSGGVTSVGTQACMAGALAIGLTTHYGGARGWLPADVSWLPVLFGGYFGATLDSYLGALVQARYRCSSCDTLTEQTVHQCGTTTELVHGWTWFDNDRVNLLATVAGAVVAAIVANTPIGR